MNNIEAKRVDVDYINDYSTVFVQTHEPKNRFQEQVVNMLSTALHGLVFPTDKSGLMQSDIMEALDKLDKMYPRRKYKLGTLFDDNVEDLYRSSRGVKRLRIFDWIPGTDNLYEVAAVFFMRVQGVFVLPDSEHDELLFAAPFYSDRIGWASQYNDLLAQKGGAK